MAAFLLLISDDLMVASRLEATARHLGYDVRQAGSETEFWTVVEERPALILLSTHHTRLPWERLVSELAARPDAPPVLAFGSHMDADTRARARAAGVTRWVANSRVAADLPNLIQELTGANPPAGAG